MAHAFHQERQPDYRQRQYWAIGSAFMLTFAAMAVIRFSSDYLLRAAMRGLGASLNQEGATQNQRHQLEDLRRRMMPLLQATLLVSAMVWAMGRFPETRTLQQELLSSLKIPIIIGIVVVVAYVGMRVTYTVVDKLALGLTDDENFNYSRRTRVRPKTAIAMVEGTIRPPKPPANHQGCQTHQTENQLKSLTRNPQAADRTINSATV